MESGRHSIGPGPRRPPIPSALIDSDGVLVCLVSDRLQLYFSLRSVRPSGLASLSVGIHIINIIARHEMMKGLRRPHVAPTYAPPPPTDRPLICRPPFSFRSSALPCATADNERGPAPPVRRPPTRTPCYPSGTTKRPTTVEEWGNGSGRTDGWGCLFQLIPP